MQCSDKLQKQTNKKKTLQCMMMSLKDAGTVSLTACHSNSEQLLL